jgi:hypothetical protein
VSTACNWIFNYMIVQITPIAISNIGYRTYIIFAVLNGDIPPLYAVLLSLLTVYIACWVPIIYFTFPETKGLELEAVDRLFAKADVLDSSVTTTEWQKDNGQQIITSTSVSEP